MKQLNRILFPFYRDRHQFLMKKWWVRLLFVVYASILLISPFVTFGIYVDDYFGWCYDSLYLYYDNKTLYDMESANCYSLAQESWRTGIPVGILGPIAGHYLFQLVFFKLVMDFIVLGGKKNWPVHPTL